MTNNITKMKLMLLALCVTFITSQEESISPYEGMSEMNRCRLYKVSKNITAVVIMLFCVSMVQIRSRGLQDFKGRIL